MVSDHVLQAIADREAVRGGFDGRISVSEIDEKPNFSGRIDSLTMSNIMVGYNPGYAGEAEAECLGERFCVVPLEEVVRAVSMHEINHKNYASLKGCPRNIDLHADSVLEPVASVMKDKSIPDCIVDLRTGQSLYDYFANMFEDWVDNAENSSVSEFLGQWFFYHDVGNHAENSKFPKLYEAFVKLQLYTSGHKKAKRLVRGHFTHDEKVKTAVLQFLERTGLKNMRAISGDPLEDPQLGYRDRRQVIAYITDEKNWPALAKIFTEEFSELIETPVMPEMFLPLIGENEFEKEMKNPETRMRLAWKRYRVGNDGGVFVPPSYMDCFDALDHVYTRLERNFEVKANAHTRSERMPLVWYGRKEFDPRRDKGKIIRPHAGLDGKVELCVGRHPYEIDVAFHTTPKGLPVAQLALLDTSSSMQEELREGGIVMNPWAEERMQWTDTSLYHYALLSWYALLGQLERHGTLKRTDIRFGNFSTRTHTARGLQEAKRLALSPQFGTTNLNMDNIRGLFSETGMLTITMSDGEISNWNKIKEEFIQHAKRNHYFHIQIGDYSQDNEPEFCKDLKKTDLKVIYDRGDNLRKIVVDLTTPIITTYN